MIAAPRAAVPEWLRGLWRRRSITHPDGSVDDTTVVYWLQTATAFADIRIPARRPSLRHCTDLDRLDAGAALALAEQGGFAGWTELDGDRCRWQRSIDFQPFTGVPDEGILRRENGLLIETGVHSSYVEVWEAVPCGAGPIACIDVPVADGRPQMLVVCGDVCLFARDRSQPLPPAPSLAAVFGDAQARGAAIANLFDCELSLARRHSGAAEWWIELSTLPFREGARLAIAGLPDALV